jgi:hypothetical protein
MLDSEKAEPDFFGKNEKGNQKMMKKDRYVADFGF